MKPISRRGRSGFTLIEVILTVSLVALLGTVFIMNIAALLREGELETLENEYWRAVDAARMGAVFEQMPHFIRWDEKASRFVVSSASGSIYHNVDTSSFGDIDLEVVFEEIAPENSYVLIRGELVAQRNVTSVGFFPDGTCTPYTVSLKIADYETRFQMDPWTGAQLVNPSEDET